jgi:hypothetical protein
LLFVMGMFAGVFVIAIGCVKALWQFFKDRGK